MDASRVIRLILSASAARAIAKHFENAPDAILREFPAVEHVYLPRESFDAIEDEEAAVILRMALSSRNLYTECEDGQLERMVIHLFQLKSKTSMPSLERLAYGAMLCIQELFSGDVVACACCDHTVECQPGMFFPEF